MDDTTLRTLLQEVGKRELGEDDDTREHSLRQFREWVVKNPNIRDCRTDDHFLLGFLRVKKFSVNQAEQFLLKFLKCFQRLKRYTRNLDIFDPDINVLCSNSVMYASPFRDGNGRGVFITTLAAMKPSETRYIDLGRTMLLNYFNLMNDPPSQVLGYVHLYDLGGVNTAHATFWPPTDLLDILNGAQQAMPLRHKEIHLINMNPVIQVLVNMVMCIMTKKMKERIHIHATIEDLHKKVSPKVLPKEYGGTMPAKEMCDIWKQKMTESREIILTMSDMMLLSDKEGDYIETGAFRKLVID